MAELIWTEPALNDLDVIADYIALHDQQAARSLVQRVVQHVGLLVEHPESGSRPIELRGRRYRQIIEPPCRVFYRFDGEHVFILYVMREEMRFRTGQLRERDRKPRKA
jgi:toxin ParE1/3/4